MSGSRFRRHPTCFVTADRPAFRPSVVPRPSAPSQPARRLPSSPSTPDTAPDTGVPVRYYHYPSTPLISPSALLSFRPTARRGRPRPLAGRHPYHALLRRPRATVFWLCLTRIPVPRDGAHGSPQASCCHRAPSPGTTCPSPLPKSAAARHAGRAARPEYDLPRRTGPASPSHAAARCHVTARRPTGGPCDPERGRCALSKARIMAMCHHNTCSQPAPPLRGLVLYFARPGSWPNHTAVQTPLLAPVWGHVEVPPDGPRPGQL